VQPSTAITAQLLLQNILWHTLCFSVAFQELGEVTLNWRRLPKTDF
jgi:hypothetical protein